MVGENDKPVGGVIGSALTDSTAQVKENTEAVKENTVAYDQSAESINATASVMGGYTDGISHAANFLTKINNSLKENAGAFTLAATSILGANHQFESFGKGVGVDTERLNTFTKQFDGLFNILANSPGVGFTKDVMQMFSQLGATKDQLSKLGAATGTAAAQMGKAFLANADNILYAQNAIIQMAGSTGEMNKIMNGIPGVLAGAGAGLENINKTGIDYIHMIESVTMATHQQQAVTRSWAEQLGTLPGGLEAVMKPINMLGKDMNAVQAAMQLATGAGMSQAAVTGMMTDAFKKYGAGMEGALKYAARASELTETLKGAKIDDVQRALGATADKFKDYVYGAADATKMTQALASANEDYANQLIAGGVPAQEAIETASKMTGKLHDLSVAQRAFISQQSGGPGGLLGSLEMKKMIRDRPDEAMAKMQDVMKKQMGGGPIVTVDTAKTAQDAAKLQREEMMLMHGPLKMADSEGEADALLAAMQKNGGKLTKAQADRAREDYAGQAIERGEKMQAQTATQVGQMQVTAEMAQIAAGQISLNGIQGAFTEKTGQAGGVNGAGAGVATNKDQIANIRKAAGTNATHTGNLMNDAMGNIGNLTSSIPNAVSQGVKSLVEDLGTGNQAKYHKDAQALDKTIASERINIGKIKEDDVRKASLDQLNSFVTNAQKQLTGGTDRYTPAGKQVGGVIPKGTAPTDTSKQTGGLVHGANQPVPVTLVGGGLTVNFVGKCPHCNADIKTTASTNSVSPSASRTPSAA